MKGMFMINVMIVEDQPLQMELFTLYIKNSDEYTLVSKTDNAALAELYLLKNRVDLILMDVCTAMGESGLDASEKIKKKYPKIKIIIITSMADYTFMDRAKRIGVESFWYKEAGEDELIEIMDLTMAGEHIYPDASLDVAFGEINSKELSRTEIEILRLIVKGRTNEEISEITGYTYNTVRKYINKMLAKTGYKNRTELAVNAVELGLLSL